MTKEKRGSEPSWEWIAWDDEKIYEEQKNRTTGSFMGRRTAAVR